MNYFIKWWEKANKNLIFPWVLAFILINLLVTGEGGQNESSRMAMMKAMYEKKSFQIDEYVDWGDDWARPPSGHYYSNKLPAPSLLGFPLFSLVEVYQGLFKKGYDQNSKPGYLHRLVLSFMGQIIPFSIFLLLIASFLAREENSLVAKESKESLHFFALAALFGHTASLLMNVYMGHGMASMWFLAFLYFYEKKNFFWVGATFGFAILTDFSAVLIAPFIFVMICLYQKKWGNWVYKILAGGIVPAILWIWYHTSCYGSPFLTANQFPNPVFAELYNKDIGNVLFYSLPRLSIVGKLIWGSERGLLFTQPWILVVFFSGIFFLRREFKKVRWTIFSNKKTLWIMTMMSSLVVAILVNSSFGGWHGGAIAGPRYFSSMFVFFAYIAFILYPHMGQIERKILWVSLIITLVFRGQVLATSILAPLENLWVWQWKTILEKQSLTPWLRLTIFFAVLEGARRRAITSSPI